MKFNHLVAVIGIGLICVGVFKPNISNKIFGPGPSALTVVEKPDNDDLLAASNKVIKALSVNADRKTDGKKLSELYLALATLIELNNDNKIIQNTKEITEANAISGSLLQLDMKGKYPSLADEAKALVVGAIGEDMIELDDDLRTKAVEAFRALSWACLEGSK